MRREMEEEEVEAFFRRAERRKEGRDSHSGRGGQFARPGGTDPAAFTGTGKTVKFIPG